MKVRDLKSLLTGVDENLEVGISYWDFTLFLKGAGVKNDMFHLEFGDTRSEALEYGPTPGPTDRHDAEDALVSEAAPVPDSAEYTIGTITTIEDPNGNSIKCWPISNYNGLVGYLRKKDLLQVRTAEAAATRNTAFRYWKLVSNTKTALLRVIKRFVNNELGTSASLWTSEGTMFGDEENAIAPLVYFPEV